MLMSMLKMVPPIRFGNMEVTVAFIPKVIPISVWIGIMQVTILTMLMCTHQTIQIIRFSLLPLSLLRIMVITIRLR